MNVVIKCASNLHAKVYIFDDSSAIVTSSNLTPSGMKSNIEYGIELVDPIAVRQILSDMDAYWLAAETVTPEMIKKVKEPLPEEYALMKPGQIIFTYFHLANNQELAGALMNRLVTAIA